MCRTLAPVDEINHSNPRKTNPMRLNKAHLSVVAIATCLALAGCDTLNQNVQDIGQKVGISNPTAAAATVGAVGGCAVGGLIGYATGLGVGKGCAAGAVLGGAVSAVTAYQRQLDAAHQLADDANAQGMKAHVDEETVAVQDKGATGTVQTKQVPTLRAVTVDLPKAGVDSRNDVTAGVVTRAATLAAGASHPVTIDLYGSHAETQWMASIVDAKCAGTKATYKVHPSKTPRIVLTQQTAPTPTAA
jgi:hypothetical protein